MALSRQEVVGDVRTWILNHSAQAHQVESRMFRTESEGLPPAARAACEKSESLMGVVVVFL